MDSYYEIPGPIGLNKFGRFSGTFQGPYTFEDFIVEPTIDYGTIKRYSIGLGLENDSYGGFSDGEDKLVCYTNQNESYGNCDSLYSVILSSKPAKVSETIKVFPNPATDKIHISNIGQGKCSILSVTGNIVGEQYIDASGEVNIAGLSPGVYMLVAPRPEGNVHLRFEKL